MKIALCISGQARSFKEGFEYYNRNLLRFYDVDVFCHSWEFPDQLQLVELYKPKKYLFECPIFTEADDQRFPNTPNISKYPPRFTLSALYSMYKSFSLIEGDYDWVIKTRYDYALNTTIPFRDLDNSKLYIPNCRMVPERNFGNDQFAFSSQKNMRKYTNTYRNHQQYYSFGYQMIGEEMMKANLMNYMLIGENLVYVDMNNPFPPGKHNGTWHSLIRDDYEQWTKNS